MIVRKLQHQVGLYVRMQVQISRHQVNSTGNTLIGRAFGCFADTCMKPNKYNYTTAAMH